MNKAVVLSSGGLDSTTVMAIARSEGYEIYSMSFDYGQRHRLELESARAVAEKFGAKEHKIVNIDLRAFGGSALTADIDIPANRTNEDISSGIPITYVPARNTIFLSYALAWAEVLHAYDIFIGVNALDYSGYPDCRPEFVEAFEKLANLATKEGVEGNRFRIHAPLIAMSKKEIILRGVSLGIDYSITHSCYNPTKNGHACRVCDSCILRKKGFEQANITDPTKYF